MMNRIRTFIAGMRARPLLAAIPLALTVYIVGLPAQAPQAVPQASPTPATAPALRPAVVNSEESAPPVAAPVNDDFAVKRILNIEGPFTHGAYVWDDEGVPDGPIAITIDLKAQTLSVFRGGYEIGAAVILYGADDKPTPLGTFPISEKDADHISNLYGAPMPYMLRLTNDGVAIHGSEVEWGAATHGCIGVPTEFARLLFEQASLGDPVIITNGKMLLSI